MSQCLFDSRTAETDARKPESLRLAHDHAQPLGVAARHLDAGHDEDCRPLHPAPHFGVRLHACEGAVPQDPGFGLERGSQRPVAHNDQPGVRKPLLHPGHGPNQLAAPLVLHQPPHEQDELLRLWGITPRLELPQVDTDVVDPELLGRESANESPAPDVLGDADKEMCVPPEFVATPQIDAARRAAPQVLVVACDVVAVEGDDQGYTQAPADGQRQASVQGEVSVDEDG